MNPLMGTRIFVFHGPSQAAHDPVVLVAIAKVVAGSEDIDAQFVQAKQFDDWLGDYADQFVGCNYCYLAECSHNSGEDFETAIA